MLGVWVARRRPHQWAERGRRPSACSRTEAKRSLRARDGEAGVPLSQISPSPPSAAVALQDWRSNTVRSAFVVFGEIVLDGFCRRIGLEIIAHKLRASSVLRLDFEQLPHV